MGNGRQGVSSMESESIQYGLRGIRITESNICYIDGERGILRYRGYDIHDLSKFSTFEETTYLLWNGRLPTQDELVEFKNSLAVNREIDPIIIDLLEKIPKHTVPMEVLRTCISLLSTFDDRSEDMSLPAILHKGIRILAKMPTIVTAYDRIRRGLKPIRPHPELSHASNFLYMLNGVIPTDEEAKILDISLILHAEHGLNASTFAGRVTSATLSDLYSAITSAIGTLKGPLHGGANQAAMRMLLKIDGEALVSDWIDYALDRKQLIMGFGHRVYRVIDPRALILREYSEKLSKIKGKRWYQMSLEVQAIMEERKKLYPNVDFYSASVYYMLELPIDLYTCLFAISRIAGWTSHIKEQRSNNSLIRPLAAYTGPSYRPYVPIGEREYEAT